MIDTFPVLCRPALPKDTAEVLELVSRIWEGNDYIPYVWEEWLADPLGILAVAEMSGRVVGLAKLSCLSSDEWFMEGLRVHPDYRAQGIAARLNGYIVDYWRKHCEGTVRLATHSDNVKVHHMSERTGFQKVMEVIFQAAPAQHEETDNFEPALLDDLNDALEFASRAPSLKLSAGLFDLGWRWAKPAAKGLQLLIEKQQVWWWRGRQGLLALWEDDEDPGYMHVCTILCTKEALAELLVDYRRLVGKLGKNQAAWGSPAHPHVQEALQQAGFERSWDKSLYIYELGK